MQARLLRYAATALRFGDAGVDPALVAFNRTVLLHGPPGTGTLPPTPQDPGSAGGLGDWRVHAAQQSVHEPVNAQPTHHILIGAAGCHGRAWSEPEAWSTPRGDFRQPPSQCCGLRGSCGPLLGA